ncbi:MAG: carboxypeptidase-like regulatory domain-containing protein [Nitrospirota bacterium]
MRPIIVVCCSIALLVSLTACPTKKEGAIEGVVVPPSAGVRIAVMQQGKAITSVEVNAQDGKFRTSLPAGTYDIKVTAPSSPFPLALPGIVVKPSETTVLSPITLAPSKGSAVITGKIKATAAGTRVALLAEGVERASVNASSEGRYEFEGIPAGRYTLQVSSPGYANDSAAIGISDDQRVTKDMRLLYITAIEGIDWSAGKIRSRGIGLPPKQAPTPTVKREMAKRAAVADAERNLLRIIELINVGPDQKFIEALGEKTYTQKLQGYLQGYRIATERDMDGGKIEVELELPLTGPDGLSSYLQPY